MTKTRIFAAAAAVVALAAPASTQTLPATVVAVVNIDRASNECNACKTALTALQGQLTGLQALQKQLATPLETEQRTLQAAITALGDKQPDAALTARVQAFEKKQADSNRTFSARDQAFQNNRAYVMQQIGTKLDPAIQSVMTKRGASLVVDSRVALKAASSIDVTNDVIAQLNATLTSISTTAPAGAAPAAKPAAAPAKPAGR